MHRFQNNYLNVFPNTAITFEKSETENIKLTYGKRINRPEIDELNPFTDITDALNPHSGNPYLKPEIIHATELGYSKEWKKYTWNATMFYRYSMNSIRRFSQLQSNGANLQLPINIGNASNYGFENIFTAIINTHYDFNASISMFQQHLSGAYMNTELVNNALGYYGKIINNFTVQHKTKMQVIANYYSATTTLQGKRLAQYSTDIGMQHKLGKGNAKLGITMVDIFNTQKSGFVNNTNTFYNYRNSKADTRACMITYAYSFKTAFKEKLLENVFSKEY